VRDAGRGPGSRPRASAGRRACGSTTCPSPSVSSACTRRHPYVPRGSSWILSMCLSSGSFSTARTDLSGWSAVDGGGARRPRPAAASMGVPGLGDPALNPPISRGALAGHEAEVGADRGAGEPLPVGDLDTEPDRGQRRDPTQAPQPADRPDQRRGVSHLHNRGIQARDRTDDLPLTRRLTCANGRPDLQRQYASRTHEPTYVTPAAPVRTTFDPTRRWSAHTHPGPTRCIQRLGSLALQASFTNAVARAPGSSRSSPRWIRLTATAIDSSNSRPTLGVPFAYTATPVLSGNSATDCSGRLPLPVRCTMRGAFGRPDGAPRAAA
jgi:hypothetical protein